MVVHHEPGAGPRQGALRLWCGLFLCCSQLDPIQPRASSAVLPKSRLAHHASCRLQVGQGAFYCAAGELQIPRNRVDAWPAAVRFSRAVAQIHVHRNRPMRQHTFIYRVKVGHLLHLPAGLGPVCAAAEWAASVPDTSAQSPVPVLPCPHIGWDAQPFPAAQTAAPR